MLIFLYQTMRHSTCMMSSLAVTFSLFYHRHIQLFSAVWLVSNCSNAAVHQRLAFISYSSTWWTLLSPTGDCVVKKGVSAHKNWFCMWPSGFPQGWMDWYAARLCRLCPYSSAQPVQIVPWCIWIYLPLASPYMFRLYRAELVRPWFHFC